jgi:hypothetical protein
MINVAGASGGLTITAPDCALEIFEITYTPATGPEVTEHNIPVTLDA